MLPARVLFEEDVCCRLAESEGWEELQNLHFLPLGLFMNGLCYNIFMITKHFFKTLIMFSGIIAVGLIGVYLVSYFDGNNKIKAVSPKTQIAK